MFIVAAFGLAVNIVMAVVFSHDHGHGHSHSHGFTHSPAVTVTAHHHQGQQHKEFHAEPLLRKSSRHEEKQKDECQTKKRWNINVQGAYLHVLGDSIQSVGVMIGGPFIWYKPEWKIIDLVCTVVFSVIVLVTTINMLRNILEVLMESTPREIDATKLERGVCEMEDACGCNP